MIVFVLSLPLLMVLCVSFSIGVPDNFIRDHFVRPEFERRWAQWKAQNITHYRITISSTNPMTTTFCPTATLEVENGAVVSLDTGDEPWKDERLQAYCRGYYSRLTIEAIFEMAALHIYERTSFSEAVIVEITYNDQYGFPTHVRVVNPSIGDMPHISVTGFEEINP